MVRPGRGLVSGDTRACADVEVTCYYEDLLLDELADGWARHRVTCRGGPPGENNRPPPPP